MLSQILASESHSSSRGMIPPRHELSLLSLTEASTKYSRKLKKYISARQLASEKGAVSSACATSTRFEIGPLSSSGG
jgi:hypothetical protein